MAWQSYMAYTTHSTHFDERFWPGHLISEDKLPNKWHSSVWRVSNFVTIICEPSSTTMPPKYRKVQTGMGLQFGVKELHKTQT